MSEAHMSRLQKVLLGPLVSEKTTSSSERENSVVFWVMPNATKTEIKRAVETYFPDVTVDRVRTSRLPRAFTSFGNRKGREKGRKKAYVKLIDGCEIQFTDFE